MTVFELLVAIGILGITAILSCILLELRYGFRMLVMQGSARRQWKERER